MASNPFAGPEGSSATGKYVPPHMRTRSSTSLDSDSSVGTPRGWLSSSPPSSQTSPLSSAPSSRRGSVNSEYSSSPSPSGSRNQSPKGTARKSPTSDEVDIGGVYYVSDASAHKSARLMAALAAADNLAAPEHPVVVVGKETDAMGTQLLAFRFCTSQEEKRANTHYSFEGTYGRYFNKGKYVLQLEASSDQFPRPTYVQPNGLVYRAEADVLEHFRDRKINITADAVSMIAAPSIEPLKQRQRLKLLPRTKPLPSTEIRPASI